MTILMQFVLLFVGFAMLILGASWFVDGSSKIATHFGIPQLVVGLTIVAMGTSAPETAVSLTAALKDNSEIAIGNVVGSNILNILIILGITALLIEVVIQKSTLKYELPFMMFITVVLYIMGITGEKIFLYEGLILLVLFVGYLVYLYRMAMKQKVDTKEMRPTDPLWKMIVSLAVGMIFIIWGSNITVKSASQIADHFGMEERFIGLTIVALGTSLPELVTSITAARKGKDDIAIGNIVGSNIYNILFVIGVSSLFTPIVFRPQFLFDTLVGLGAGVLLWLSVCRTCRLKRPFGILMLISYAIYFFIII